MAVRFPPGIGDSLPDDARADAVYLFEHAERQLAAVRQRDPREAGIGPARDHLEVAGFGVFSLEGGERRTAIVSYRADVRGKVVYLSDQPAITAELGAARSNLVTDPLVIGLPPPVPQAGCGSELWAGNQGTPAAIVTRNGSVGLLTAGHVASAVGSDAFVDGIPWGTVEFTTSGTIDPADVAFVVGGDDVTAALRSPQPSIIRIPELGEVVSSYGSLTCRSANVMGIMPFQWFPALGRNLGEIMLTAAPISVAGDSGALVLLDEGGEMVGHVVGGDQTGQTYTSVQLAGFALAAADCVL